MSQPVVCWWKDHGTDPRYIGTEVDDAGDHHTIEDSPN
ncbi:MAG: hypothetical protein AVDCRST_MAG33-150 [uncultured Thermomicrobiales bacterium]|uniref:Uncharacterized protein n=1 Tax=uncultured Thermomicrobiales bacterium TaxID=1645740 RepID=A0A6J4U9L2_9BACT|nr:MAG: hypothetical protein AVDCRST_MAG33-150 [uncultured Thermomicrobiales bacterium]